MHKTKLDYGRGFALSSAESRVSKWQIKSVADIIEMSLFEKLEKTSRSQGKSIAMFDSKHRFWSRFVCGCMFKRTTELLQDISMHPASRILDFNIVDVERSLANSRKKQSIKTTIWFVIFFLFSHQLIPCRQRNNKKLIGSVGNRTTAATPDTKVHHYIAVPMDIRST